MEHGSKKKRKAKDNTADDASRETLKKAATSCFPFSPEFLELLVSPFLKETCIARLRPVLSVLRMTTSVVSVRLSSQSRPSLFPFKWVSEKTRQLHHWLAVGWRYNMLMNSIQQLGPSRPYV